MREGFKSYHGEKTWTPGKWYKVKGKIEMCENGFHGSTRIVDAMSYVPVRILAKVEVRGESIAHDDKQCWSEMRITEAWKWTKEDSVALALYSAKLVLGIFEQQYPGDERPRRAIAAAKRWLANPTEENRKAADAAHTAYTAHVTYAAADAAAYNADRAARSAAAAASAVTYAAYDAAYDAFSADRAARSAADAAAYAAYADGKVRAKIDAWISRRVEKLEKIYDQKEARDDRKQGSHDVK